MNFNVFIKKSLYMGKIIRLLTNKYTQEDYINSQEIRIIKTLHFINKKHNTPMDK